MFIPSSFNFTEEHAVIQGDTFERKFEFTNFDVTGKTLAMQVRQQYQTTSVLDFSTEDDSITIVAGVVTLKQDATTMDAVVPRVYVYDLKAKEGAEVTTIMRGTMLVLPSITD